VAYVYRHFNDSGSLPGLFLANAERIAQDEDVTVFASAASRAETSAPLAFETVEPLVVGRGRLVYAVECATFGFRATRRLRRLRTRFDVVHVDGFAATEADLATVHAVRSAEIDQYFDAVEPTAKVRRRLTPWLRPQTGVVLAVERRLYRPPYPVCLAPTRGIADDLERHYGVPSDLIEVMPYGIDVEHFSFDSRSRVDERSIAGIGEERLVLMFVGDDFGRKGLDRAIASLAGASNVDLWVAGGGPEAPFRALARTLGVEDRLRFLGRVKPDGLARLYSAADVLLLPSRQDAWGQPVIEAMAAGRVVLVSELTGAHEAVQHGATGYVLDGVGSAEQIASLVSGPLADQDLRAAIGRRAAETVGPFDRTALYPRFRAAHHRAARLRQARLAGDNTV
jgi:glycosyltransferase involved in cell wall biosynthesis